MKKKIVYSLILFVAIVLQTSVLPLVCCKSAIGDIVLALVLTGAILDGFSGFLWWAIFAGIMYDLASYSPIGTHALIFLLAVYFVSFFSRRFSMEIRGVGVALFGIFIIMGTLVSRLAVALVGLDEPLTKNIFLKMFGGPKEILLQILINMVLFFVCLFAFRKAKKFYALD